MSDLVQLWGQYLPDLVQGAAVTLQLLVAATLLAVAGGLIGAGLRLWGPPPVRRAVGIYVDIVRIIPGLVLLFLVYYGLPEYGIVLPAFVAGFVSIGFLGSAFFTEIFRGGILSVDQGQWEAGEALGLSRYKVLRIVVLPQVVSIILPPSVNMVSEILKTTSLVIVIGAGDLMYQTYNAVSRTYQAMELLTLAGIIYLAFLIPLTVIAGRLEARAAVYRR